MISYYANHNGRLGLTEQAGPDTWIHLTPPFSPEELPEIAERYELPIDFLTDPLDIDERSRYEREDDARLIVVNTPILSQVATENDSIYITVPIGIILAPEVLITITSSADHPVLQLFIDNKLRNVNPAQRSLFVLRIFEQTVYRFLTCLKTAQRQTQRHRAGTARQ